MQEPKILTLKDFCNGWEHIVEGIFRGFLARFEKSRNRLASEKEKYCIYADSRAITVWLYAETIEKEQKLGLSE